VVFEEKSSPSNMGGISAKSIPRFSIFVKKRPPELCPYELTPKKQTRKESTSCEKIAQEVLLCQVKKECGSIQ
jgi:hypothetical protein